MSNRNRNNNRSKCHNHFSNKTSQEACRACDQKQPRRWWRVIYPSPPSAIIWNARGEIWKQLHSICNSLVLAKQRRIQKKNCNELNDKIFRESSHAFRSKDIRLWRLVAEKRFEDKRLGIHNGMQYFGYKNVATFCLFIW